MDVEPKYEIFGREIEFEGITPITGFINPESYILLLWMG